MVLRILCCVAFLFGGILHAAVVDVPEAGFELDDAKATWKHWTVRSDTGTATCVPDLGEKYSGKMSAHFVHTGERSASFNGTELLPVKTGNILIGSAWIKIKSGAFDMVFQTWKDGKPVRHSGAYRVDAVESQGWFQFNIHAEVHGGFDAVTLRFIANEPTEAWFDDVQLVENPAGYGNRNAPKRPLVNGYATSRLDEKADRGLLALQTENGVHLGWRLLKTDPKDVAFDVYRSDSGKDAVKVNAKPVAKTTDFLDTTVAPQNLAAARWFVRAIGAADMVPCDPVAVSNKPGDDGKPLPYISIPITGLDNSPESEYTFQKFGVGDLDGDGKYEFVLKSPNKNIDPYIHFWTKSPGTYKLDAFKADGTHLWRHDLGWSIERGVWYSPYIVYDLDGDGKAEVVVKTAEGDHRDENGRVFKGPEYLTVLDGETGKPVARTDWLPRNGMTYNYSSRNQMCVAYLDGRTPCLIVERGTYDMIQVVAYQYKDKKFTELWRWSNETEPRICWGQGSHTLLAADVDADGRDELVVGSFVLNHDGSVLWATGMGHPDHVYVGDIDPDRPGLEMYFGIEWVAEKGAMNLRDAKTGELIWEYPVRTNHIHSQGMCADIDARFPGMECFSGEQKIPEDHWLRDCKGNTIEKGDDNLKFGLSPRTAWWDADPQKEMILDRSIIKYPSREKLLSGIEGRIIAVCDIFGDWREEIIVSVENELRIYSTTIPAANRQVFLMQDPLYRMGATNSTTGYYYNPTLGPR